MRAQMILYGTLSFLIIGVALFWRPMMTLALALLGAAVSVWRMKRPVKHAVRTAAPAPVRAPAPPPAPPANRPANENDEILTRLAGAGWTTETAASGAPWLVALQGGVRIALRTCTAGPEVTLADVADAVAARDREAAQYVAVISLDRPADAVAGEAKAARVHLINLPRLEAYLALASSFKSPPVAPRRLPA